MAESTARRALALGLLMSGRGAEAIAELEFVSVSKIEPVWFEAELLGYRAYWRDGGESCEAQPRISPRRFGGRALA